MDQPEIKEKLINAEEEMAQAKERMAAQEKKAIELDRRLGELKEGFHDFKIAIDKVDANAIEGAKALILLNSGAVAAMLAFMQALVGKGPTLIIFKHFGVLGLIGFLIGASIAASVFTLQAHGSLVGMQEPKLLMHWRNHSFVALAFSLALFLVSASTVVAGIYLTF